MLRGNAVGLSLANNAGNILDIVPEQVRGNPGGALDGLGNEERLGPLLLSDRFLRVLDANQRTIFRQHNQKWNLLSFPPERRDAGIGIGGLAVVVFLESLENHLKTSSESGWGTRITPFSIFGR